MEHVLAICVHNLVVVTVVACVLQSRAEHRVNDGPSQSCQQTCEQQSKVLSALSIAQAADKQMRTSSIDTIH